MQIFSYLSKIASSGSLLSWDGTKIAASKGIIHNPEKDETTIGGSLSVEKAIRVSGGVQVADGTPYVVAGENVDISPAISGAIEISAKSQSPVLWRWNEKDASQFTINCDTIGTGSISAINTSWGKAIRVDFRENISEGIFAFSINDLNLQLDDLNRYRYVLRFRLCNFSGSPKEWTGIGSTFLANTETNEKYYGLGSVCYFNSQQIKAIKVEAGSVSIGKYTPTGPRVTLTSQYGRPITNFEHEVVSLITRKSIGFQNTWKIVNSTSILNGTTGLDDSYYTAEFGGFKGEWANQKLNSCGIVIMAATGNSQAYFDIDCIEVTKHLMDW